MLRLQPAPRQPRRGCLAGVLRNAAEERVARDVLSTQGSVFPTVERSSSAGSCTPCSSGAEPLSTSSSFHGIFPVNMRYDITPRAQKSASNVEHVRLRCCSGDINGKTNEVHPLFTPFLRLASSAHHHCCRFLAGLELLVLVSCSRDGRLLIVALGVSRQSHVPIVVVRDHLAHACTAFLAVISVSSRSNKWTSSGRSQSGATNEKNHEPVFQPTSRRVTAEVCWWACDPRRRKMCSMKVAG
ncbi:hypothetical protein BDZ89DRAFT_1083202 [Hymenopellis radicata]|nr:hypothetical protein BDZ89DRAFT_1083202 [Hymenopellis radicata]